MANNIRQFKHPIPTRPVSDNMKELSVLTPQEILDACKTWTDLSVVSWNGLNLAVRRLIGTDETIKLVCVVLDQCWSGDGYLKEKMDFTLRSAIITFYSNAGLPEDAELRQRIVYETDLYETVRMKANEKQIAAIEDAVRMYMQG